MRISEEERREEGWTWMMRDQLPSTLVQQAGPTDLDPFAK